MGVGNLTGAVIEMRLDDQPFELIGREEKTVEVRLYDEKRKDIKVGDTIVFHNANDEANVIAARVKALHLFDTFFELFSSALFPQTGFGATSASEATEYMYKFYSKEREQRSGVVGIEIEVDENLSCILSKLLSVYRVYGVSNGDIISFARLLHCKVFIEKCNLNDVLIMVYNFEEAMRDKGAVIETGEQCVIYDFINMLGLNEE